MLKEVARRLAEKASASAVILFGSRARGDDGPDSDYDICVVIPADANPTRLNANVLKSAVAGVPLDIQIVVGRPSDLDYDRHDVNSLAHQIWRDGRILRGHVTGFPAR